MKLAPNHHKAQKTYDQQMKHLERSPEDKEPVIKSEVKLQQLGFVEQVKNLSEESQKKLRENDIHNFLPWRVVLKENSMTSPSRAVFDGSQLTDSSYNLNNLLPKGINMLNKLVEIFIRWRYFQKLFTAMSKRYTTFGGDIHQMTGISRSFSLRCPKDIQRYSSVRRILVASKTKDLDSKVPPEEKIIKTMIYETAMS